MKKLLYISNWPFSEGLTQSTVLPHLSILEQGSWDTIYFASLEMKDQTPTVLGSIIKHVPFCMTEHPFRIWDRVLRWRRYTRFLKEIIECEGISCILARGAAAGIIAARLARRYKLSYYVESFEPHAAYMLQAGIWKWWDPRYLGQLHGERLVKKSASGLMPVSNQYKVALISEGLDKRKIRVVPCAVPVENFAYRASDRDKIREKLSIPSDSFTAIYVGKLGGLYYDIEAVNLWAACFRIWPEFQLIWLTPQDKDRLGKTVLKGQSLPPDRLHIRSVPHEEVTEYLSAADFAFSLHRATKVSAYFSPIKDGEYWANGLPIVITAGVGDDAMIIQEHQIGIVLPGDWPSRDIDKLLLSGRDLLTRKPSIQAIAIEYRSFSLTKEAYAYFGID